MHLCALMAGSMFFCKLYCTYIFYMSAQNCLLMHGTVQFILNGVLSICYNVLYITITSLYTLHNLHMYEDHYSITGSRTLHSGGGMEI